MATLLEQAKKFETLYPKGEGFTDSTWIYVIKCNEFYKIGIAFDLAGRANNIQTNCPYEIEIFWAARVYQPLAKEIEKLMHDFFVKSRVKREWFRLSQIELDYIQNALN